MLFRRVDNELTHCVAYALPGETEAVQAVEGERARDTGPEAQAKEVQEP